MKLINIRLIRAFNVNDADRFTAFKAEIGKETGPEVQSNVSRTIAIAADVDQEDFRDKILFAVEAEKDSGIFELQQPNGSFTFSLKAGETHSSEDGRFKDVYVGHVGRNNFEPGDDGIWLELTAPREAVDEIAAVLANNPQATLEASVELECFTNEMDDALREWYHRRDMFVENDHAPAFLSRIEASTGYSQPRAIDPDDHIEVEQRSSWTITGESSPLADTKAVVAALQGVRIAIYVAAAAIIATQFI